MFNADKLNKHTKFNLFYDALHISVLFRKRAVLSFFTEGWSALVQMFSK